MLKTLVQSHKNDTLLKMLSLHFSTNKVMKAMSSYLTLSFSKEKAEETLERKHQNSNNHPHGNHLNINWHPG